ncbi:uncharacterized protein V1516DRAFT_688524 [Lipomyces oligophaga]|uniref:uncharacterized protein n=1 Tax=Lipomyces oligophaga TaxID=45792 RepID=UPI0034CFB2F4
MADKTVNQTIEEVAFNADSNQRSPEVLLSNEVKATAAGLLDNSQDDTSNDLETVNRKRGRESSMEDRAAKEENDITRSVLIESTDLKRQKTTDEDADSKEPNDVVIMEDSTTEKTNDLKTDLKVHPKQDSKTPKEDIAKEEDDKRSGTEAGDSAESARNSADLQGTKLSSSADEKSDHTSDSNCNTPKPSVFGSLGSGKGTFGSSWLSGSGFSTPLKPFGSSVFGQPSSETSKPFTSFSSFSASKSNPFLHSFGSDKDKLEDEVKETKNHGINTEETTTGAVYEPYVQLKLQEQKVATGEESEKSVYSCRAKLYAMYPTDSTSGWKERGTGSLHLNVSKNSTHEESISEKTDRNTATNTESEGKKTVTRKSRARIVMRADGVLKVVLNLPLAKGIEVMHGMKSSLAGEKVVRIATFDGEKPIQYAFRLKSEANAKELLEELKKLVE